MARAASLKTMFLATRPMFFPAAATPVLVGGFWGFAERHVFSIPIFALTLIGMLSLHGAANVFNDVADEKNGCDKLNDDRISPFTGGSRFLQTGDISLSTMTWLGVALVAAAALTGLALAAVKGPVILAMGAFGVALLLAYSAPPLWLAASGAGEAAVGVGFGLPVLGAYFAQTGQFSLDALTAAGAIGCWSAAILLVNEVPDAKADAQAQKRTLVVRLGRRQARWLYLAVQGLALILALILLNQIHAPWTLRAFICVPAFFTARAFARWNGGRDDLRAAILATLNAHLAGGLLLAAAPFFFAV